jgi:drug/metabolite transporter (DMT)-like permease
MTIGTLVYAPFALTWLKGVDLTAVSALAWVGVAYSAAFSLVAAYIIWYTAVHQLGGSHTAIYSNVVPIVAMAVATLVLGEPTTSAKLVGTAAVLAGVAFTRLDPRRTFPASEG